MDPMTPVEELMYLAYNLRMMNHAHLAEYLENALGRLIAQGNGEEADRAALYNHWHSQ